MVSVSDFSLVTQVAVLGNRKAFDKLVVKYQSPVRRFFLHQTGGDSQLSDDLAQDTFVKAYTYIRQFRGTAQFSTWLMRIAYNVFYDYCRKEDGLRIECDKQSLIRNPSSFIHQYGHPLRPCHPEAGGTGMHHSTTH